MNIHINMYIHIHMNIHINYIIIILIIKEMSIVYDVNPKIIRRNQRYNPLSTTRNEPLLNESIAMKLMNTERMRLIPPPAHQVF